MKKSHQSNSNPFLLKFKQGNQFDVEASARIKDPKEKYSNSLQRIADDFTEETFRTRKIIETN